MRQGERSSVVHCGHEISRQELKELRETVELFRGLSRWELAQTICEHLADQAAREHRSHVDYLAGLAEGDANLRRDRAIERRIRLARFPVIKTLDQFQWSWPKKINRLAVQNLFRLKFLDDKANVIFLGGVGLGKTHLATALGYDACLQGRSVLFATAVDVINTLSAAQAAHRFPAELKKYLSPPFSSSMSSAISPSTSTAPILPQG
jgi:DNA replication protein DnaC